MNKIERNVMIRATLKVAENKGITVAIERHEDETCIASIDSISWLSVEVLEGSTLVGIGFDEIKRIDEVTMTYKLLLDVESQ